MTVPCSPTVERLVYRYAERQDVRKILALEAMQDADVIQLTEKEFYHYLQGKPHRICLIAETEKKKSVDAYMLYFWPGDHEGTVKEELHVTRLLVHPDERYGPAERGLFKEIIKRAVRSRSKASYWCRERDLGQQLILRDLGFRATKVLRGYFVDTGEDAFEFVFIPTIKHVGSLS